MGAQTVKQQIRIIIWRWGVVTPLGAAAVFGMMLKEPVWYLYPRMLFGLVFMFACTLVVAAVLSAIRGRRRVQGAAPVAPAPIGGTPGWGRAARRG